MKDSRSVEILFSHFSRTVQHHEFRITESPIHLLRDVTFTLLSDPLMQDCPVLFLTLLSCMYAYGN